MSQPMLVTSIACPQGQEHPAQAGLWAVHLAAAHKLGHRLAGGTLQSLQGPADEAVAAGCLMAACLSSLSSSCTFSRTAVHPGMQLPLLAGCC